MKSKQFHISDVLSIVPGLLVSSRHLEGVYDILNWMTGENLFTHQLPRACKQCSPFLLAQFPWLAGIDGRDLEESLKLIKGTPQVELICKAWVEKYSALHGEYLDVAKLPPGENGPHDPVQEAIDMVGADRVLVVTPEQLSQIAKSAR
jgi:hypothetical protein